VVGELPVIRGAIALFASIALGGCLRTTSFTCHEDGDCSTGRCETGVGFCSFSDPTCDSGRRFGDLSGSLANQCVDGSSGGDGGVDTPAAGCPASYISINGSAHRYKLRSTAGSWTTHKTACAGENAFLAVPDDAAELDTILSLSNAVTWVGITDAATEGTYLTVLGTPATFLPWATGEPNNQPAPGADCVRALTTKQYADDRCSSFFVAVCECVP
jgi:lectin-like protein